MISSVRSSTWCLALAVVGLGSCRALADDRYDRRIEEDIRRQEGVIRQARERLETAKQRAASARAEAATAQGDVGRATERLKATRLRVEQDHDAAPALVAARQEFASSKAALEAASAPVLAAARQRAEYQGAVTRRESARKEMGLSRGGTAEREKLAREILDASTALHKLEQDAIAADPAAAAAQQKVTQAETSLRELVRQRDAAIRNDPRVAQNMGELDTANAALAAAQQRVAGAERHVGSAEREVQREHEQKLDLERRLRKHDQNDEESQKRLQREEQELKERLKREKEREQAMQKDHERRERELRERLERERKERERQDKDRKAHEKKDKKQDKKPEPKHDKKKDDKKKDSGKDDKKDKKDKKDDKKK